MHGMTHAYENFIGLGVVVLTLSDTRNEATDRSGKYLTERVAEMGHDLRDYRIIPDEEVQIRAFVEKYIEDEQVHVVLCTGGTGLRSRDVTPDVVKDICDTEIPGFGEYFRYLSINEIGSSTIQSRAMAGLAQRTLVVCLPGSTGACRTAWEGILQYQLNATNRPCNFVEVLTEGSAS